MSATYVITDSDDFELPCATTKDVFAVIDRFCGEDVRIMKVEGPNGRRTDHTQYMAELWWQNECSCIYSVPEVFEPYLDTQIHRARERAEDPRGEYAAADAWRDSWI